MLSVTLHDCHGFRRRKRLTEDGRIPQQQIEFGKHEFTESHILTVGHRFDELTGRSVVRRGFAIAVKQEIRVDGEHGRSVGCFRPSVARHQQRQHHGVRQR
jgi:hypothetical protein